MYPAGFSENLLLFGEFYEYIDKNIEKIDTNIPVFFGHVATTLDNSLPDISEDIHDQFIDSVTWKVLEASKKGK